MENSVNTRDTGIRNEISLGEGMKDLRQGQGQEQEQGRWDVGSLECIEHWAEIVGLDTACLGRGLTFDR